MKRLAVIAAATAVAGFAFPAVAQAEFQSPSTNIHCSLGQIVNGDVTVTCALAQHYWVAPPRSPNCHLNWGSRIELDQSGPAHFDCYGQPMPTPDQTLAYGGSISHGPITCYSEITGMTCRNNDNGHFFKVSRESYELG
jgi:Family of unknown function (DUF6636)